MRPIDADVLIERIENIREDHLSGGDLGAVWACDEIIAEVKGADTVDAVPVVHGRWIVYNYPACECVYCSECKEQYDQMDLYIGGNEYPNYCPNCGARMDGE